MIALNAKCACKATISKLVSKRTLRNIPLTARIKLSTVRTNDVHRAICLKTCILTPTECFLPEVYLYTSPSTNVAGHFVPAIRFLYAAFACLHASSRVFPSLRASLNNSRRNVWRLTQPLYRARRCSSVQCTTCLYSTGLDFSERFIATDPFPASSSLPADSGSKPRRSRPRQEPSYPPGWTSVE
jgi:hypothetical protein